MSASRYRAWVAGSGAALLLAACGGAGQPTPAPGPSSAPAPGPSGPPPNIILIVSDDLDSASVDLLPGVRSQLVERGLTLVNSFAPTPLCGPSRASILTGRYAHNHGIRLNASAYERFHDSGLEGSTLAVWLQAAGYRTAFLGKYMNHFTSQTYVPPGWDEWDALVDAYEEDPQDHLYYNYTLNENGGPHAYRDREDDYLTDVLAGKAVDFLKKTAASGPAKPFFLYIAPTAPHANPLPAYRDEGAFPYNGAPRTPSFNEQDMGDKPLWYQQVPRLTVDEVSEVDDLYRHRLRAMLAVDSLLDDVLDALASIGKLDDTFVFYTSDNGYLLGQHRFYKGKDAPYEQSIRVPLIVRGPGVPAGQALPFLAANIDLPVTFADLARARAPDSVDGRSLAPLLRASPPPRESWRQDLLVEHWADRPGALPTLAGLRTSDNLAYFSYETGEAELYDLTQDPDETESQIRQKDATRADPAVVERLAPRLSALQACHGASCR